MNSTINCGKALHLRMRSAAGISVVCLVAALVMSACSGSGGGTATGSSVVSDAPTAGSGAPGTSTSTPPTTRKTASKPSTTKAAAKATAGERSNATAKLTTLGAGTFTVGTDIPPGRYVITAAAGETGNLTATTSDDPLAIDEILGAAAGMGVPSVTADLVKGEQLTVSNMSNVKFTPAVTKLRTSLTTGDWLVGTDIKPGRYVAAPGARGGSGNFFVYSDGLPVVDEILGKPMGVPSVTVNLTDGEQIQISSIADVVFTAK